MGKGTSDCVTSSVYSGLFLQKTFLSPCPRHRQDVSSFILGVGTNSCSRQPGEHRRVEQSPVPQDLQSVVDLAGTWQSTQHARRSVSTEVSQSLWRSEMAGTIGLEGELAWEKGDRFHSSGSQRLHSGNFVRKRVISFRGFCKLSYPKGWKWFRILPNSRVLYLEAYFPCSYGDIYISRRVFLKRLWRKASSCRLER